MFFFKILVFLVSLIIFTYGALTTKVVHGLLGFLAFLSSLIWLLIP
ncbi:MAG: hypothetical protein GF347_01220 [Candidatus Moranbacteria bacterium]|nr:hypothetical protein [Candidatus Moranbacteria bacterium]